MRKLLIAILLAASAGITSLTACCDCQPGECWEVLTISECSQETFEDFFAGRLPDVVLECPKGWKLEMEASDKLAVRVKVLKDCFIRCTGKTCLFSTDFEEWLELAEFFK